MNKTVFELESIRKNMNTMVFDLESPYGFYIFHKFLPVSKLHPCPETANLNLAQAVPISVTVSTLTPTAVSVPVSNWNPFLPTYENKVFADSIMTVEAKEAMVNEWEATTSC
jgi:hypothetical protein